MLHYAIVCVSSQKKSFDHLFQSRKKLSFITNWLITSKASIRTTASWQDCEIERKRRNKAYRQVAGVLLPSPLWFTLSLTFELVWTVLALFVFRVLETQAIWNFSVHVTDSFNKCNDAILVSHGDIATTRWQICISRYPVSAVCVAAVVILLVVWSVFWSTGAWRLQEIPSRWISTTWFYFLMRED